MILRLLNHRSAFEASITRRVLVVLGADAVDESHVHTDEGPCRGRIELRTLHKNLPESRRTLREAPSPTEFGPTLADFSTLATTNFTQIHARHILTQRFVGLTAATSTYSHGRRTRSRATMCSPWTLNAQSLNTGAALASSDVQTEPIPPILSHARLAGPGHLRNCRKRPRGRWELDDP